jgi:tRNA (guanine-N7-)-methyltransferase
VSSRLAAGGELWTATDDGGYAAAASAALDARAELAGGAAPRPPTDQFPVTHFERLARDAGRPVAYLRYRRA